MVELMNKPYNTMLEEVANRIKALNPIDRQSQLAKMAFKQKGSQRR